MTSEQAESAITISALVTTGLFGLRKVLEPEVHYEGKRAASLTNEYAALFGAYPPIEWGQYLKAAGSLYIALAIVGAASPDIGGSAAILVGISALIGQGVAVSKDLHASSNPVERTAVEGARKVVEKPGGLSTLPKSTKANPLPILGG